MIWLRGSSHSRGLRTVVSEDLIVTTPYLTPFQSLRGLCPSFLRYPSRSEIRSAWEAEAGPVLRAPPVRIVQITF